VSERSIDLVLKTSVPKGTEGSNPSASSIFILKGYNMKNIKTFIAAAVVALTAAACTEQPEAAAEATDAAVEAPAAVDAAAAPVADAATAPAAEAAPAAETVTLAPQ